MKFPVVIIRAGHASVRNRFSQQCRLTNRQDDKAQRIAARAQWRAVMSRPEGIWGFPRPLETSCKWTDSTRARHQRGVAAPDQYRKSVPS